MTSVIWEYVNLSTIKNSFKCRDSIFSSLLRKRVLTDKPIYAVMTEEYKITDMLVWCCVTCCLHHTYVHLHSRKYSKQLI